MPNYLPGEIAGIAIWMGFGFVAFASFALLFLIPFWTKTKKYEIGIFGTKAMVKLMIGGLILIFLGASASLVVFPTLTDVPVASSGITNSTSGN